MAVTELDTYREWRPPPQWRHVVACCWEQEVFTDRVQHVLPDGHADLIVYESGRIEVVGLHDRVALPILTGGTRVHGVRLRPEAVGPAFRSSGAALRNVTVDADDVFGAREAARLADRRRIDRWIGSIVPDDRTAAAVRLLASHTVAETAERLGITDRHLRRVLLNDVGLAPKPYQRVLRLRRFLAAAETRPDIAAAAAAAGYVDQSHLTRETHALAGQTPAQLLELRGLTP